MEYPRLNATTQTPNRVNCNVGLRTGEERAVRCNNNGTVYTFRSDY